MAGTKERSKLSAHDESHYMYLRVAKGRYLSDLRIAFVTLRDGMASTV